jgi:Tol biopolymer transport system component
MRQALAVLAVVALIVVGAWAYTRPGAPVASPSPSPTATASGTAAVASPTPAATPTGSVSPTPSPTATATAFGPPLTTGGVTVRTAAARLSADFKYVTTRESTGTMHWIVLLDLAGRRAHYVAEIEIAVPAGSQAAPSVAVSPSADGRAVLLGATEPAGLTQLFHVAVESGQVRYLRELDQFSTVVLSPDGTRYAFTNGPDDSGPDGLWVGRTAPDEQDRHVVTHVIGDDPNAGPNRPRPIAFSPDSSQIAAVATIDAEHANGVVIADVDAFTAVEELTFLRGADHFDWLGAPDDAWAWGIPGPLGGGNNAVQSFDLRTGTGTLIYRPANGALQDAGRSPDLDRFFTQEGQSVLGGGGPLSLWVRTRQGDATKVADVGEGGPRLPWWSPDGSRLYAFRGEDDSVGTVVDVLTGEVIVDYCIRNAGPGCV